MVKHNLFVLLYGDKLNISSLLTKMFIFTANQELDYLSIEHDDLEIRMFQHHTGSIMIECYNQNGVITNNLVDRTDVNTHPEVSGALAALAASDPNCEYHDSRMSVLQTVYNIIG